MTVTVILQSADSLVAPAEEDDSVPADPDADELEEPASVENLINLQDDSLPSVAELLGDDDDEDDDFGGEGDRWKQ